MFAGRECRATVWVVKGKAVMGSTRRADDVNGRLFFFFAVELTGFTSADDIH